MQTVWSLNHRMEGRWATVAAGPEHFPVITRAPEEKEKQNGFQLIYDGQTAGEQYPVDVTRRKLYHMSQRREVLTGNTC
ncbi:hypothetical protein EYF80_002502 [Liparis tanakae]|uniref:Uncharacterized protein n=1 Tax=Liparis tanakae TaxID=230148 RepID=A0A4Z2JB13_9TELE|nr:hypothetical protein EYF80_002502 [Liparis tanakae]